MHDSFKVINYINSIKINISFITEGLTSIIQHLDVCINFSVKNIIRDEYEHVINIFNSPGKIKIKRDVKLDYIMKRWSNNNEIINEMIKNSFLY